MEETEQDIENEMIHSWLRHQWYPYECADKDKLQTIIQEELKSNPKMRFDRVMMKIRRRADQECR